ncbi:MAG: hypothetical protein Q4F11_05115, partial [Eubacteriales bacterium]|nr:hypothetical protein [Eubacteriales bacterium]
QTSVKRIAAFMAVFCLVLSSLSPAAANAATSDGTVPAVEEVTRKSQETAGYLLSLADYSTMTDTSVFYNASRNLFLAIRSGLECNDKVLSYITAIKPLLDSEGKLTIPVAKWGYANDVIACEAYMINILAAAGLDVNNFDNKNLVAALNEMLSDKTLDDYSNNLNCYHLGMLYAAVDIYSAGITNSSQIKELLLSVIEQKSNENGFDCWGFGGFADDYGTVLPGFSSLYEVNSSFKTIINNSKAYADNNFIYGDNGGILSGSEISANSTALALAFFTTFDEAEKAAVLYNALMSAASNDVSGQFTGYNPILASQDALLGLVTYQYSLSGIANVFDTRKTLVKTEDSSNSESDAEPNDNTDMEDIQAGTLKPFDTSADSVETADVSTPAVYTVMLLAAVCSLAAAGVQKVRKI